MLDGFHEAWTPTLTSRSEGMLGQMDNQIDSSHEENEPELTQAYRETLTKGGIFNEVIEGVNDQMR